MSDRLAELRRQRALVQSHLEWLDRELAREAVPPVASPRTPSVVPPVAFAVPASASAATADELLRRYAAPPQAAAARTRLGCWVGFVGAFLALGGSLVAWYLLRAR